MPVSYDRLNTRVRDKYGVIFNYTPAGGTAREVKGVIERAFFPDTGSVGIQSERFRLQVVDDDVPELAVNDVFEFAGVNYAVRVIEPDFFGMTDILLQKA
jgi:hypothetical protein